MAVTRTHRAVATTAVRAPLEIIEVQTISPLDAEVLVKVEYVASTPLDLHQADGGLLVQHPQVLGDTIAGTVTEVGAKVQGLAVGDKVFGFAWRDQKEKGYQEFVTFPEYLLGKVPAGFKLSEAVTVPDPLVTAFHTITKDLELSLPWPRPPDFSPQHADAPVLIWGGSSSVGTFILQVLRFYGYRNLIAVASKSHHGYLSSLGARVTVDYHDSDVTDQIMAAAATSSGKAGPAIPYIVDCIGSMSGSLLHLAKVAQSGTTVAVMLPVIVRDASVHEAPVYAMDPGAQAAWTEGVVVRGVRTHFYLENSFLKTSLQSVIMPALLSQGIVKPSRQRTIEGHTLLERAQKALNALREKSASGERLVFRVPDGGP